MDLRKVTFMCHYSQTEELPVSLTIRPEQDQITYVGESSAFLCYIEGDGAPTDLVWRDPSGQIIRLGVPGMLH